MKDLAGHPRYKNMLSDPRGVQNENKVCFVPLASNKLENLARSESPIKLKPAFIIGDYAGARLDNPAYFDAVKIRKEERIASKRKKFSSLGMVPGQTSSAKLTKIPGLNIWRLDFSKVDQPDPKPSSTWCRLATTLAMLIVLVLLIGGIAVIVHAVKGGFIFGMPWFPFENENAAMGMDKVAAHFRIMNRHFTPELSNASSEAYHQLAAELRLSFDIIFLDSPLANYYNTSEDFLFTNGSVVVECILRLTQRVVDGAQNVGFAFLRALEKGKGILPPGRLYVDVHTVRFAAVSKQIDENILQDLHGLEPWSEWSSCIRSEGACDASQMRVRRRKCGGPPLHFCDTEVVETKPCTCPPAHPGLVFARQWSEWNAWSACPTRCDQIAIQRRTRHCSGTGGRTVPTFLCSRDTGEAGTQIRHCQCTPSAD